MHWPNGAPLVLQAHTHAATCKRGRGVRRSSHTYPQGNRRIRTTVLNFEPMQGGSPAKTASKGEENSNAVRNFSSYLVDGAHARPQRARPGPDRVRNSRWSNCRVPRWYRCLVTDATPRHGH